MASTFPLEIVTPEKSIWSDDVISVQLVAASGSLGILAGHAPLLADLGVGECVVKPASGAEQTLVLAGGFIEVSREKTTILADSASFSHEINVDEAEQSLARARELLSSLDAPAAAREEAALEARRAEASLRIARGE